METLEVIKKIAEILAKTEQFICQNSGYLPQQRSRLIDMSTLVLSEYEDDFFTYDQLKLIVVNMVNRHISGDTKWFIDMTLTTPNEVVLINESDYSRVTVPAPLYLNMVTTQAVH